MLVAWTMLFSVIVTIALPEEGDALPLDDDAVIEGKVTYDGENGVEGVYVKAMLMVGDGLQINSTVTDSAGDYDMAVPGGFDYAVFTAHEDYLFGMSMATVDAGETVTVNFTLTGIDTSDRTVTLKGNVKDGEDNPVTEGTIFGFVSGPAGPEGMPYYGNYTTPDGSGNYELKVITGEYGGGVFIMDLPGYEMQGNETEDPLETDQIYWLNITLSEPETYTECSLNGYVTEAGTGVPLAGVLISIESYNETEDESTFNYTLTDEDGYYLINLTEGDLDIHMQKSGYTSYMDWDMSILKGETLELSVELLPTVATIKGNVTDAVSSDPLPFATVVIVDFPYARSAMANESGYYELAAFEGDDLDFFVELEGYSNGHILIDVGDGVVIWHDFELLPIDATLSGKVTDIITGDEIEGAWVHAYSVDYEDWAQTNETGNYTMDLVSGVYTVEASAEDYMWTSAMVTIDPGANSHDIQLMPVVIPMTVRMYGWVNESGADTPIDSAEVVVYLDGSGYWDETEADMDGYYEIMVPPIALDMYARGNNHAPYFGSVDASVGTEVRKDVLLDPDMVSPVGTGSHDPSENITWSNPDNIYYEIEDANMYQISLFMFMQYEGNDTTGNYSVVAGWGYSNDPIRPQSSLPCSIAGDMYTVDMLWDATADGGWLSSPTDDEMYIGLSEFWYYEDEYRAIRALYSNSTVFGAHGSALFDPDTGDYVMFVFDSHSTTDPGDEDGVISPLTLRLEEEGDALIDLENEWILGDWSIDGLTVGYQERVPSGNYYSLIFASDWGDRQWADPQALMVDNDPPVAEAGPDRDEVVNTVVALDGTASTDNYEEYLEYLWEFDDGGPVSESGALVNYTFTSTGEYEISLTVTDGAGHVDSDTVVITVNDDMPPTADAGPDMTVPENTVAVFNGSGSYDDVAVVNYTWTILELDVILYEEECNYTFSELGEYTLQLVVNDTINQTSDPDEATITVVDVTPPVANAGLDMTVPIGVGITFDGSSSTDNHEVVNYTWTFTDGDDIILYGVEVDYTFVTPGEHEVTLTVEDAAGNSDTDEAVITVVDDEDPVADAGPDQTVAIGEEVEFDGSGSSDNSGIIENYTWTFEYDGDDRELYGVGPVFTFESDGEFIVMLTVEDAAGNYDTDTVTIWVNSPPVADAGDAITADAGEEVEFDGSGSSDDSGSIENYTWTFVYDGEEVELYGVSPSFVFDIAGEYTVTLTVTDPSGLTDTDTVEVTILVSGESFLEENWWILAIIAIVVVAAAASAAMIMSRKGGAGGAGESRTEMPPEEEMEELPPPPPDDL